MPQTLLFIPLAEIIRNFRLGDTPWSLILTYPTFLIPFCTWLMMGYFKAIPKELEECARIDGASRVQTIRYVIIPLLYPTIRLSAFFAVVGSLQLFDLVMPLTRGGPADSSQTMVSFLYTFGVTRMRVGFGSAVGVILFVICVTFAFTYKRWFMRDE